MQKSNLYNQKGEKIGEAVLPESIFGLAWNGDLVHQVVVSMNANARETLAHTKGRGEVRGGGKKPWRQKGTGRARHGSRRSPIWVGGGVSHGPRKDRDYSVKINKKMRTKALFTALSEKARDGEIVFIDTLNFDKPRTTVVAGLLKGLAGSGLKKINFKTGNRALFSIPKREENLEKSFANIKSSMLDETRNLNPVEVLNYKYVVFVNPIESIKILESRIK